jgi:hypothetical protein
MGLNAELKTTKKQNSKASAFRLKFFSMLFFNGVPFRSVIPLVDPEA